MTLFICRNPLCCTVFPKAWKVCERCGYVIQPGERGFRLANSKT